MNKIIITGNVTNVPELKGTPGGHNVCSFGVAVNERRGGQDNTTFFRVSAWNKLAETCMTYLQKGKKVMVIGSISGRGYIKSDGSAGCSLDINANEVEFLSPREDGYERQERAAIQNEVPDMTPVETDEPPF